MFLVFGDKHRTEAVENGRVEVLDCPECGRRTEFHERVVSQEFRVYFVGMFTHGTHHVMACGLCGTAFVTDELADQPARDDQSGTVFGHLKDAVDRGRKAVDEVVEDERVREALQRAKDEAGRGLEQAQSKVGAALAGLMGKSGRRSEK